MQLWNSVVTSRGRVASIFYWCWCQLGPWWLPPHFIYFYSFSYIFLGSTDILTYRQTFPIIYIIIKSNLVFSNIRLLLQFFVSFKKQGLLTLRKDQSSSLRPLPSPPLVVSCAICSFIIFVPRNFCYVIIVPKGLCFM